tara:strand:+ start:670 stop:1323 length:654 start_codon:yes stop_codon:yes gene_type:complete
MIVDIVVVAAAVVAKEDVRLAAKHLLDNEKMLHLYFSVECDAVVVVLFLHNFDYVEVVVVDDIVVVVVVVVVHDIVVVGNVVGFVGGVVVVAVVEEEGFDNLLCLHYNLVAVVVDVVKVEVLEDNLVVEMVVDFVDNIHLLHLDHILVRNIVLVAADVVADAVVAADVVGVEADVDYKYRIVVAGDVVEVVVVVAAAVVLELDIFDHIIELRRPVRK